MAHRLADIGQRGPLNPNAYKIILRCQSPQEPIAFRASNCSFFLASIVKSSSPCLLPSQILDRQPTEMRTEMETCGISRDQVISRGKWSDCDSIAGIPFPQR